MRERQKAEAQYAKALNLIRGIDERRDDGEVSGLLESACAAGVSEACEDIDAKNLSPPELLEWSPIRPTLDARRSRLEGLMLIKCRLPTDGVPKDCRTIKPMPFGMDKLALTTIPTWRYRPAAYKGESVEVGLVILLRVDARH